MSWLNEYPTKVDIIMKISTRLYSESLLFALQRTQLTVSYLRKVIPLKTRGITLRKLL